jgi:probable phosphoglycerate mutase
VGARAGLTLAELAERYPEDYAAWMAGTRTTVVAGEETTEQVRDRVVPALRDCVDALAPGQTGVVVLHGACLKVGLMGLLDWPWRLSRSLQGIANGAYCVLAEDLDRDLLRLASYNQAPSRPGDGPGRPDGNFVADGPVG